MSNGRYERQLVNHLASEGYHVMRAPSSGGGTKRNLPDVFWSKHDEQAIAAELKMTNKKTAYFDHQEVAALVTFASAFNAQPMLVARFKGDMTFYVVSPCDCKLTESNTHKITTETDHYTIEP